MERVARRSGGLLGECVPSKRGRHGRAGDCSVGAFHQIIDEVVDRVDNKWDCGKPNHCRAPHLHCLWHPGLAQYVGRERHHLYTLVIMHRNERGCGGGGGGEQWSVSRPPGK
jgi:hypothetical protein